MKYYMILADIGGSNIKNNLGSGESVSKLNDILTKSISAVGFVVIAIAIIKMIIALSDENSKAKADSTIMLGVGLFFAAAAQVVAALGVDKISSSTSLTTILGNILTVIGNLLTYAGGALIMVSVFSLVLSIMHESPDQQAKASNLMMVGVGLLSANALTYAIKTSTAMKNAVSGAEFDVGSLMIIVVNFIGKTVSYGGGALVALGVFKFVMSLRTEEPRERDGAIKMLLAGIAFLSFTAILHTMFGFKDSGPV